MIEELLSTWNIKPEYRFGDVFSGYEDHYEELDKFTKEKYDANPEKTIDDVFSIYRSRGIVPIVYYSEDGLISAIKDFSTAKYHGVQGNVIGLGNNVGQISYIIDYHTVRWLKKLSR